MSRSVYPAVIVILGSALCSPADVACGLEGTHSSLFRIPTERNCIHLQNPVRVYPQWLLLVTPCRKFSLFDLWRSCTSPSKMLYVLNYLIQYTFIFLISFLCLLLIWQLNNLYSKLLNSMCFWRHRAFVSFWFCIQKTKFEKMLCCEKCSYISIQCLCVELTLEPNILYLQEAKCLCLGTRLQNIWEIFVLHDTSHMWPNWDSTVSHRNTNSESGLIVCAFFYVQCCCSRCVRLILIILKMNGFCFGQGNSLELMVV